MSGTLEELLGAVTFYFALEEMLLSLASIT
jgi:hypothetical protein